MFQPVSLGLFRNDYMLDVKDSTGNMTSPNNSHKPALKQIEFNTIASSFGGLVSGMWQIHRLVYFATEITSKGNNSSLPSQIETHFKGKGVASSFA